MKQAEYVSLMSLTNKNYVTVSSAATKVVEAVKVFVAVFLSRPAILLRSLQRVEKRTRCADRMQNDRVAPAQTFFVN